MGEVVGDNLPVALGVAISPVQVVAYAAAPARLQGPLDELRVWLTDHNAVVMAVLLLVMGVAILGKGLGAL